MATIPVILEGAIVLAELVDGSRRVCIQLTGQCPECGEINIVVADHHLKTLRDLITDAMDKYPVETHTDSVVLDHYKFEGPGGGRDPSAN